jgi:hypothetical protein
VGTPPQYRELGRIKNVLLSLQPKCHPLASIAARELKSLMLTAALPHPLQSI